LLVIPRLSAPFADRTRLRLRDCKRERPRIKSGAGCGGAQRERHGRRESIGVRPYRCWSVETDSGSRSARPEWLPGGAAPLQKPWPGAIRPGPASIRCPEPHRA